MKKSAFAIVLFLLCHSAFSQGKEKIKGSKIVTVEQKEVQEFETLEVSDNLEIFIIKGDKCSVEIEADDNLHDAIQIDEHGNSLMLSSAKDVTSSKKFSVRVTYTDNFKVLIAKNHSNITALADISLDNFTFKSFDESKIYANIKSKVFTLIANDKSKAELNLKADVSTIELSKNAQLKALISSGQLTFDMYQKTTAAIEGDVNDLKLRLDNNSNFAGKNFTAKNAEVTVEGYTSCSILVNTKIIIDASGKSEIQLYGDQKIEMKNFKENATLYKKPTK